MRCAQACKGQCKLCKLGRVKLISFILLMGFLVSALALRFLPRTTPRSLRKTPLSLFIAKVIATNSNDGCRFFTTLITASKQLENNERIYKTFHVICLMAHVGISFAHLKVYGCKAFALTTEYLKKEKRVNNYARVMGNSSFHWAS